MVTLRVALTLIVLLCLVPAGASAHPGHAHPEADHADTIGEVNVDFRALVEAGTPTTPSALGGQTLPTTHCDSTNGASDYTGTHAVHAESAKQFKLVYAYASDSTPRFEAWRDALQANVSLISRFLANESLGRKAPRFDMGTDCGPDYVDIQVVQLDGTQAALARNFNAVLADVEDEPGISATKNLVVLGDHLTNGGLSGTGELYLNGAGADREDASNWHNNADPASPRMSSIIWIPNGAADPANTGAGYWPEGFLHEMAHNMGAVQWSAPHTSRSTVAPNDGAYGHCWDGPNDIMCYDDGPLKGHAYETTHCTSFTGLLTQSFDCNRDDYFDARPVQHPHFDAHWNVFDSVYLADCAEVAKGCGWDGTSPTASDPPTISGTARAFESVTGNAGTWTGSPTLTRQWQREVDGDFADVPGATGSTLTLQDAWVGTHVRLKVTAAGTTAEVAHSAPVRVATATGPQVTAIPVVTGVRERGETLTTSSGTWVRATSFSYEWHRSGDGVTWTKIADATGQSYVQQSEDIGSYVAPVVTAVNSGGSQWYRPGASRTTTPRAPQRSTSPTVSGTARRGQTLTTNGGTWDRAVTSRAYQWQRSVSGGWQSIAGATGSSHTLAADDVGSTVRVVVTATGFGGQSPAEPSAATAQVATGIPVVLTSPTVTGVAKPGRTLVGTAGSFSGADTVRHLWERSVDSGPWVEVTGDGREYALTHDDVGARLRFVSLGTGPNGTTENPSTPTATVTALQSPLSLTAPTVAGTAKRGQTLTRTAGTWTGATGGVTAQWQRSTAGGWESVGTAGAATYAVGAEDVGRRIRILETATNGDGSIELAAAETALVADLLVPVNTALPIVSGTPQIGSTLTATSGSWTNAPVLAYRWQRQAGGTWTDIFGATAPSYAPTEDVVGSLVRVEVAATGPDGTARAASAPVTIGRPPATAEPKPEVVVTPSTPPSPAPTPAPSPSPTPLVQISPPKVVTPAAPAPQQLAMRGATLLTFTVKPAATSVTLTLAAPVRLKAGKHVLTLCVKKRCTKRSFTAKGKTTKLPSVKVPAKKGDVVKATLTGASGRSSGSLTVR